MTKLGASSSQMSWKRIVASPFWTLAYHEMMMGVGRGVKVQVCRKKIHTDQYLRFHSHHPLNHKLGVIWTLYDQCDSIIKEETDMVSQIIHVDKALCRYSYTNRPFTIVRDSMDKQKQEGGAKKKRKNEDSDIYTKTSHHSICQRRFKSPELGVPLS